MTDFLSGLWAKAALAAAFVGLVLLSILKLLGAGRDQEKAAQAQRNAVSREKADEVDRMVDGAGDVRVDELRNKWTR